MVHSCSKSHGSREQQVAHTSEKIGFFHCPGRLGRELLVEHAVGARQLLLIDTLWWKIKREALTPLSVHLQRYCRTRGEAFHLLWQENKGVLARCLAFFYLQQLFFFCLFQWVTLLMCQTSRHDGFQLAVGASAVRQVVGEAIPTAVVHCCIPWLFHLTVIIVSTFKHSISAFFLPRLRLWYASLLLLWASIFTLGNHITVTYQKSFFLLVVMDIHQTHSINHLLIDY